MPNVHKLVREHLEPFPAYTREHCRKPHNPSPAEHSWLRVSLGQPAELPTVYAGSGCTQCNMTGYQGRTGVYEVAPAKFIFNPPPCADRQRSGCG